jgi:outer membrane protein assembly factor BamB
MIAAKSVSTGETLWNTEAASVQNGLQIPFLVDEGKLFTGADMGEAHRIICRSTSSGKQFWTADLRKFSPYSGLRDMLISGDRLFILSDYYVYALDAAKGRIIWKTRIWRISKKGVWRRISDYIDYLFRKQEGNAFTTIYAAGTAWPEP